MHHENNNIMYTPPSTQWKKRTSAPKDTWKLLTIVHFRMCWAMMLLFIYGIWVATGVVLIITYRDIWVLLSVLPLTYILYIISCFYFGRTRKYTV